MDDKQIFMRFLKRHNLYKEYISELRKQHTWCNDVKNIIEQYIFSDRILDITLTWSRTVNGYDYWLEKNMQYREYKDKYRAYKKCNR